jgi:phosphoesterase RecJ-like protein
MSPAKEKTTPAPARAPMARILAFLQRPGPFLLTGHVRADGDALGAALGLARLLSRQRRRVVVAAEARDTASIAFLEGREVIVPAAQAVAMRFSAMISLDCGDVQRLPDALQPLAARLPIANIDHHRTNTAFGQVNWIDSFAGSTSEMIWRLARRAGWSFDRVAAEALWVGLITDTGRFAYDQTSPRALRCGADLLRYGVRTAWINDHLYGSFDMKALELKKRAFHSLEFRQDGRIAAVTITRQDFAATDSTKSDAEDIIEIPRSLRGNLVALFFYETGEKNVTRVSIRTRAPLDATQLALHYGGGGHARAAGCTLHQPLAKAKAAVLAWVEQWLKEARL